MLSDHILTAIADQTNHKGILGLSAKRCSYSAWQKGFIATVT
ncbi:hypothetical protein [Pseudanabaena sp. UWO310]|nr:hypothetical protein [Pseudanabaena sp. UWO310]